MNMKELIQKLCDSLEWKINQPMKESEIKPRIKVYFHYNHFKHYNGFAFEARIDVDRVCSFRELYYYEFPEKKTEAEKITYERLLDAAFCYGVMSAKKQLDQILNPPTNQ